MTAGLHKITNSVNFAIIQVVSRPMLYILIKWPYVVLSYMRSTRSPQDKGPFQNDPSANQPVRSTESHWPAWLLWSCSMEFIFTGSRYIFYFPVNSFEWGCLSPSLPSMKCNIAHPRKALWMRSMSSAAMGTMPTFCDPFFSREYLKSAKCWRGRRSSRIKKWGHILFSLSVLISLAMSMLIEN